MNDSGTQASNQHQLENESGPNETPPELDPDSVHLTDDGLHRRNFIATTVYQVSLRIGWIFKTESVIMPAALDSIGATGWIRGFLPMLNRLGQSIPPLLIWPAIKGTQHQQKWLAAMTFLMGIGFLGLSAIWAFGISENTRVAQSVFLVLYGLFFVATGICQLTLSTLIGKLIRVDWRGRLMLAANTFGCLFSIACAWFVLRNWMKGEHANFAAIFATSGSCFLLAAFTSFWLDESRSPPVTKTTESSVFNPKKLISDVMRTWIDDRQFRMVAIISALFGLCMTLQPHYQSLGRARLDIGFEDLLFWLIIQNFGVAVLSIPVGWVADRLGNRMVLRLVLLLFTMAPIGSLLFANSEHIPWLQGYERIGFLLVYFLLGLTPVTMRILSNYSLEFTSTEHHPQYLAAQSLAMAVPVIGTSILIGLFLDWFGYEWVFGLVIAGIVLAWILTFFLHEPRHLEDNGSGEA